MFWVLMAVAAAAGDDEFVSRLQRRDPQALAELYDRYGRLVYSLILRVVRDTGVAEDLVQETFLRVWSRAGGFDSGRGAIGPWLLTIARNRAIDYTRSAGGRTWNGLDLDQAKHSFRCPDMEKDILLSDGARRVRAAMSNLPPQQREAIELAYFEGLSQTEMAERMGQPLGTIKTWADGPTKSAHHTRGHRMNCEDLRDHYDLYVLGVADREEGEEIRAHLDRHCPVCEAAISEAAGLAALMSAAADPASPPPSLRRRILASAGVEPRRYSWMFWVPLAACLLLAVSFGVRQQRAGAEAGLLRAQLSAQAARVANLTEALSILNGPDTTEVTFGQGQPRPPQGKVFVNPGRGVLLIASNLPPAPAGKIYEMWVIPRGGQPVPAGLFQADPAGTAVHFRPGGIDVRATGAIAVTLENEAGAQQPTSTPLIVAAL